MVVKNLLLLIASGLLMLFLSACEGGSINIKISNLSDHDISVYYRTDHGEDTTKIARSNSELFIYQQGSLGNRGDSALLLRHIDTISLSLHDSLTVTKDIYNEQNWENTNTPFKKGFKGENEFFVFTITSNDIH